MPSLAEALALAFEHHQAGWLAEAEPIYRQILAVEPNQAEPWHLLGCLAHQTGRHEMAVQCITRAIGLNGTTALFHRNLAEAYRALRRFPEAVACCRRALQLDPNCAPAHASLGNALRDQGSPAEAAACYRQALALAPSDADACNNLGAALQDQGQLDEALAAHRRALQLKPDFAEAHYNLGRALNGQGQAEAAIGHYQRTLALKPDFALAHLNLANALRARGKLDEAVAGHRRAVELMPDYAPAHSNLGEALWEQGDLSAASTSLHRALQLTPDYAEALNNLGNVLKDQGRLDEALAALGRALQLKPHLTTAHSNLLLTLQYCDDISPAELAAAHREFGRRHAASPGSAAAHPHDRDPHRPLRLGFVSPDLGRHPVGFLLIRVLESLAPRRHEIIAYSGRVVQDDLTRRFQAAAAAWRDVAGMSDPRLEQQVRADRIDILFDLAGHTNHNRLPVFARKPAPLQITWLGYQGTTGVPAMDYLLTDGCGVPESSQPFYTEKILRLPDGFAVFEPPADAPDIRPLPAIERGYVTFGACSNPAKVNPGVIARWAQILKRLPQSRLILKYKGMHDREVRQRYYGLFAAQGIPPQRVDLMPAVRWADRFDIYHQIDIGLDTFPYSGNMTTCDALWMGVPVVTWPSDRLAGRQTMGNLTAINLPDTIAGDLDQYVEIAVTLAHDLPRLAALRAGLRERMAASPLCDAPRFAENLAVLLRNVWQRWCAGGKDEG